MKRFIRSFKNNDIVGVDYVYFDRGKPNKELISEYIKNNLVFDGHKFPLGSYPAVKLMKIYEPLKQRLYSFSALDNMLGYFQNGDKWSLSFDHKKKQWALKVKIRNLPVKAHMIDIYQNVYTQKDKKVLKHHFENDEIIFEEYLNESARRACYYIKLNKENFYY